MEHARFDHLARTLSNSSTRRGALVGLLTGVALPMLPGAAANAKKKKKHCPPNLLKCKIKKGQKKKTICVDGQTDATNCGACGAICPAGQACCAGACIDTQETAGHCGRCGNVCTSPQTCGGGGTKGVCGCTPTTCEAEQKNCGDIPDGCGGTLGCGQCTGDPETCGGGGVENVCGCQPNGTVVDDRVLCCSNSCCRDELSEGQCRCAGGCG